MKKIIIVLLLFAAVGTLWGQTQATFSEVNGKVEVRPATGGAWVAASPGMDVQSNTMIATGFNASAAIRMGDSTVRVEQLTRMEFEGILEQSDAVETRLNLNVGKMSAQVRSSDGRAQNFQVRSPISTAAVRGTDFEYDGEEIKVQEGTVVVISQNNQEQPVTAGQQSTTTEDTPPSSPAQEAADEATTSTAPTGSGSSEENDQPGPPAVTTTPPAQRPTRGSIVIEIK